MSICLDDLVNAYKDFVNLKVNPFDQRVFNQVLASMDVRPYVKLGGVRYIGIDVISSDVITTYPPNI